MHSVPVEGPVTISFAPWGLPTNPGFVSWCKPIFLTAKLNVERTYRFLFVADSSTQRCSVQITDTETSQPVASILREGTGGLFPGVMAGPISCKPDPMVHGL